MTAEETRALAFNLSLIRRENARQVRAAMLKGNEASLKGLTDRLLAVTKEESNEQRLKTRYDERYEPSDEFKGIVNG